MNGAFAREAQVASPAGVANAFTVDVEDYFHVEAFRAVVDRSSWENRPSRVVQNTERVLALLKTANARGTFFVLGWVAERFPELVRRIAAEGHEVASHGYGHERAVVQTRKTFREDVRRAKAMLEKVCDSRIRGYRAPTFSITPANTWCYEILSEEGYEYSSSIYPISHDFYHAPDAPRTPFCPLSGKKFLEIPLATIRLLDRNQPCAGGGYFRLLPYCLSRWSIRRFNRADDAPCVFYCHPWEFDPYQPRIPGISMKSRFRHYLNLGTMERRVSRLLADFVWGRIDEIFMDRTDKVARIQAP